MPHSETVVPEKNLRWYQGLERYCWIVLIIAALGWLFDTMDQNIFNLVAKSSVEELIKGQALDVTTIRGYVTAAFLVGWAGGGFIFGVLGDRIGRVKTMILTIIVYAAFTGLSGLAQSWQAYAFMRFLTGLGVGGEWAAGAAIVAEVFPERSRAMALGTLQALSAVGNMTAAVVTFVLAGISWRWAYAVGALPALLVFWIGGSIKEPERWQKARDKSAVGKELGALSELFQPALRRNTIAGLLMAVAGQAALWGVGFWSVDLFQTVVKPYDLATVPLGHTKSAIFLIQQLGAGLGVYAFAMFTERTNRRTAFAVSFALAWIAIPVYFWGVARSADFPMPAALSSVLSTLTLSGGFPDGARTASEVAAVLAFFMGFATLGPFSGYTVYFPELFPTRLRSTGCGICYNGGRIFAAIAPIFLGQLSAHFAAMPGAVAKGMPMAATVVTSVYLLGFIGTWMGPETKGKPLPE